MTDSEPVLARLRYTGVPIERLNRVQAAALVAFRKEYESGDVGLEAASCLCGNSAEEATLIAAQDRHGLPVDSYLCPVCGRIWSSPRMTLEALGEFYDDHYRAIYIGKPVATDSYFKDQCKRGSDIHRFVSPHVKELAHSTVLDIGCSAGGLLMPFHDRGARVAGCDLTSDYVKYGQEVGLSLVHGGAENLRRFAPADLLIASHVLEHCPSPITELKLWNSLLADGGYLYLGVPSVLRCYENYGDVGKFLQLAHLYHFTLRTLIATASRAGFRFVKGDQGIRAVFVKSENVDDVPPNGDEYRLIFDYLVKRERVVRLMRWRRRILHVGLGTGKKILGERLSRRVRRVWRSSAD